MNNPNSSPVRPPFICAVNEGGSPDQDLCQPCAVDEDEEELVDFGKALINDPIVGVEQVVLDEQGPGALEAVPMKSPPSMSPAQWAKHCLTHLP